MRRLGLIVLAGAVIAALAGWFLTRPADVAADFAGGHVPDAENGALVFAAGGCVSCHAAPRTEGEEMLVLAGGLAFPSDFGTFHAPNISPHPEAGIGAWTLNEFARALTKGVSPRGGHYYPAFPYTAYQHMTAADVSDLFAYMRTLPPSPTASLPHDVAFPFSIRRAVGGWKLLFMKDDFVLSGELGGAETRGRYLAEGLAHCGECHTPRGPLGDLDRAAWLSGAPNPSGKGKIPNITPGALDWSQSDLVAYFETGFTPEYDSAGGEMAEVIKNLARLPASDREAIAAYLKAVPAIP